MTSSSLPLSPQPDRMPDRTPLEPAWSAVFAMALGVFGLITAEFLPASLLTPMAASLGVTEGQAGQTVTVTAIVAFFTCMTISAVTRKIDRRWLLIGFMALLTASNLLVACASNLAMLLGGRVLLGIALGGFWTLSAAVTMRLVPSAQVPRALSIIYSGISVATIAAVPLGSYLGHLLGWRSVFMLAMLPSLGALIWQLLRLPAMPASGTARFATLVAILKQPGVAFGMGMAILIFSGHFAFFTYLRPFLENVAGVGVNALSAILLGFGLANLAGTLLAGFLIERSLRMTQKLAPLVMGAVGLALVALGAAPFADGVLIALWGMAFGAVPVAWSTWITRTVPDEAESANGLMVGAVQLAISAGAAGGGLLVDMSGAGAAYIGGAVVLLIAAAIF